MGTKQIFGKNKIIQQVHFIMLILLMKKNDLIRLQKIIEQNKLTKKKSPKRILKPKTLQDQKK